MVTPPPYYHQWSPQSRRRLEVLLANTGVPDERLRSDEMPTRTELRQWEMKLRMYRLRHELSPRQRSLNQRRARQKVFCAVLDYQLARTGSLSTCRSKKYTRHVAMLLTNTQSTYRPPPREIAIEVILSGTLPLPLDPDGEVWTLLTPTRQMDGRWHKWKRKRPLPEVTVWWWGVWYHNHDATV